MDIEQLSKSQIVLLTLLVSFVTSIATGIVTVSLMDQAPPAIAQTVNRIIERTVEKVVPAGQSAATVITQEKTVVVKESTLISEMVSRIEPSVVRLYTSDVENPQFLGLGVVSDGTGMIVSGADIGDSVSTMVERNDNTRVRGFISSKDAVYGLSYFTTATTTADGKPVTWKPVTLSPKDPMLGESLIAVAGRSVARIAAGIVTALVPGVDESAPQIIETDIAEGSILPGSPLFDTDGNLRGLSTAVSRAAEPSSFVSARVLVKKAETSTGP